MSARRPLLDKVVVRVPFAATLTTRMLRKVGPDNPLRRRFVKRAFTMAWDAVNRADFEVAFLFYEDDAQVSFGGTVAVGLTGTYSGRDGWAEFMRDIRDNFEDA